MRRRRRDSIGDGTEEPYHLAPRQYKLLFFLCLIFLGIALVVGGVLVMVFWDRDTGDNRAPIPCFTVDVPLGPLENLVQVNATCTTDPEGDAITYAWTWNDGTPEEVVTEPVLNHTYTFGLPVEITLCASDPLGHTRCKHQRYTFDDFFRNIDFNTNRLHCGEPFNACSDEPYEECCNGQCSNLEVSPANCGRCGAVCAPQPFVCYLSECINTYSDRNNCGAIGNICPANEECCAAECTGLQFNEANCGACGNQCPPNWGCAEGHCVDLLTNPRHCGAVNNACPTGWDCCTGVCRNIAFDTNNCGACGRVATDNNQCTLGDTCANGQPVPGVTPLNCDDQNDCTADLCSPEFGCVNDPLPAGSPCGGDPDFECRAAQCLPKLICGNGYLQPENGETCDDGNNLNGDGCSANCRNELSCAAQQNITQFITQPGQFTVPWRGFLTLYTLFGCSPGGGGGGAGPTFSGDTVLGGRGGGGTAVLDLANPLTGFTQDIDILVPNGPAGGNGAFISGPTLVPPTTPSVGISTRFTRNGINLFFNNGPGVPGARSSEEPATDGGLPNSGLVPGVFAGPAGTASSVNGGDGGTCSGGGGGYYAGTQPLVIYGEGGNGGRGHLRYIASICTAWNLD